MKNIRVLIAKVGLDGHDRGAKVVARALRDAGMEVVYTGIRTSPEEVVETAIQEDVDVIGISALSGGHLDLFPLVMNKLKDRRREDVLVIAGGVIPEQDIQTLHQMGISAVFGPGTFTREIVDFINANTKKAA